MDNISKAQLHILTKKIQKETGNNSSLFFCLDKKTKMDERYRKKFFNAKQSFGKNIGKNETCICLLDDTVFGSSKDGFIITTKAIYYKPMSESPKSIIFEENTYSKFIKNNIFLINNTKISVSFLDDSTKAIVKLINMLCSLKLENEAKITTQKSISSLEAHIGETYIINNNEFILTKDGFIREKNGNKFTFPYEKSIQLIDEGIAKPSSTIQISIENKKTEKNSGEINNSFIYDEDDILNNNDDTENKSMVAKMIESMAMLGTSEARQKLKKDALGCTLDDWKYKSQAKCGGVGFLTGVVGGPMGLAMEAGDTGYLLAMAGQSCYGIGHILGKQIDYNKDIEGILAIWSGAAKGISKNEIDAITGTKLAVLPIGGKMAVKLTAKTFPKLVSKVGGMTLPIIAKKISPKLATKLATKVSTKVMGKAGAKVSAKVASKISTKWIPIAGGVISAGINIWIIDTMIGAAEEYYRSDYVLVDMESLT